MASHFSNIGFPVASEEAFRTIVMRARDHGRVMRSPRGRYRVWTVGQSIELWVQDHEAAGLGINPHFAGSGRMMVGVSAILSDRPDHPMDGSIAGWADPDPNDPQAGACQIVLDLPDFHVVTRGLRVGSIITVQIAAFAHTLACHDTDEAFDAAQSAPKWAPESFMPTGMFDDDDDGHGPTATAMFAGHVAHAALLENPVTGCAFHHIVVQTLGGTVDVVADPNILEGQPVVGGVVQGTFWLSGRILEPTHPRRGILARLFRGWR